MALELQMATTLCFFMQNGVPVKDVEVWATHWADTYRTPLSSEVRANIMQHNLDYSPLNLQNLSQAFDAQVNVYDTMAEESAITFVNLLENALRPYFENRKDLHVLDVGCGSGLAASPVREYTEQGGASYQDKQCELYSGSGAAHGDARRIHARGHQAAA